MLAFLLAGALDLPISLDYQSGKGLTVEVDRMRLVQGSYFQAYAPGWKKGYYSSNYNWQNVTKNPDGSITVTFTSTLLDGRIDYGVDDRQVQAKYRFTWKGSEPALLENSFGHFWSEPWKLPTASRTFDLEGKMGEVHFETADNDNVVAIDGRTNDNDWAKRKPVFWIGWPDLKLEPGKTTTVAVTMDFNIRRQEPLPDVQWKPKESPVQMILSKPSLHPALVKVAKPALPWRGVHLFVGPDSRGVHEMFAKHVFPALGINKVVLQCERAEWKCLPGTTTDQTTSLADLKAIFDTYRANGIEPIPLIQSWGHMEWFFANGQNKELAYVPGGNYCIDPRKATAKTKLADIWKEAVALLHPKTIHFGLDEVQMQELPKDSALVSAMWKEHLPWLGSLAKQLGCTPMFWGDIALGQGEAPDATSQEPLAVGAERRAFLPKGGYVADWHYLNSPKVSDYPSLRLFQKAGMKPIASTWYSPQNIFGFTQAAIRAHAEGTLQTNWQGYTLSPVTLSEAFDEYSAMVLSAYYARTGDTTPPEKLGWSPGEALREIPGYADDLRFRAPAIARDRKGVCWTDGSATELVKGRGVSMLVGKPIEFNDPITGTVGPNSLNLPIKKPTHEVVVALYCKHQLQVGDVVGYFKNVGGECGFVQELYYGRNVSAPDDPMLPTHASKAGKWVFARFNYDGGPLDSKQFVSIIETNPAAGLVVGGVALIQSK